MIQSNMEEGSHDGGSGLYLWQQIQCGYLHSISSKKADREAGVYPTMLSQWPISSSEDLLPKGLTNPKIIPQLGNKYEACEPMWLFHIPNQYLSSTLLCFNWDVLNTATKLRTDAVTTLLNAEIQKTWPLLSRFHNHPREAVYVWWLAKGEKLMNSRWMLLYVWISQNII